MLDGLYQSVICYYMAHFLFSPATFNSITGLQVNDGPRMGVYVATAAVIAINLYILMNMYRWDSAMIFACVLSILFIIGWTGIYSSFTPAFMFYQAANQVFQQPSFWAQTVLTVILCVLPRFVIKSYQKMYKPRDIDIVREQVRQGKFSYLDDLDPNSPAVVSEALKAKSSGSSEDSDAKPSTKMNGAGMDRGRQMSEDERPIYPPSTTATNTTRNPHSTQNSDDSTPMPVGATKKSLDCPRISLDPPPRPSFDRMRSSMDQLRPSFEALRDMTSASQLSRIESSHSGSTRMTPAHSREPSRLRGECHR